MAGVPRKLIVPACLLLAGAAIGAFVAGQFRQTSPAARFEVPVERDLDATHEMSAEEAETVRRDRFASIHTIEDTLALPTDFAETEALYVIAGRADAEEVQNLIYQAGRIRELEDRHAALGILFLRLTELDPKSAVAIARSPMFGAEKSYEEAVWTAWGRLDLDGALAAAKQADRQQRELVAQALYASLRGLGDARVEKIDSALGIEPGRNVRAQHLYALFTESPAEAIRYIESQPPVVQGELYGTLASFVSRAGIAVSPKVLDLITSPMNREMFDRSLGMLQAASEPEAVLGKALAAGERGRDRNEVLTALRTLARSDPDKALDWARSLGYATDESMLTAVIGLIAGSDPDRALNEARSLSTPELRSSMFATIASQAKSADEVNRILAMIDDPGQRRRAIYQVAMRMAMKAPADAVAWASTLPDAERQVALQPVGQQLVRTDIDAAIALLGRLPAESSTDLAGQIASSLAQRGSGEEALAFIAQYKDTAAYPEMQMTVLNQLSNSNPEVALRMAQRIDNVQLRGRAYATIAGNYAKSDLPQATSILNYIEDPRSRMYAINSIVHVLNRRDPNAARNWVIALPPGSDRDAGISRLIATSRAPPRDAQALIDSIGDDEMRKHATLSYAVQLGSSNPDQARKLLDGLDLTDQERQQYERVINGNHGDVLIEY